MGVSTVGESAIFGEVEDLFEITGEFFGFYIKCAETFDAWGVDEIRGKRKVALGRRTLATGGTQESGWRIVKRNHLAEGGGVHTHVVGIAEFGGAKIDTRHETIDESGLPYPTIAAEYSDFVFKQLTEVVDALTRLGRHLTAFIAYGLVEIDHRLLIAPFIIIEQVGLIEDEHHWHTIGLGGSQKTVYERGAGLRVCHRNHQKGLVHIRCNDMALLGEVDAFADDIVTAIVDGSDERTATRPSRATDSDPVAYGHRVGRANALQAEISLYLTIKQLAIVRPDGVPTACVLYDKSFQV